jgi:hypothetical protein
MPSLTRELKNLAWSWKHKQEGERMREDYEAGLAQQSDTVRESSTESETVRLKVSRLTVDIKR